MIADEAERLRAIVIDGDDVALHHGDRLFYSCKGIRECVSFFQRRGHTSIHVFVSQSRRDPSRNDSPIADQHILMEMENEKLIIYTPSRRVRSGLINYNTDFLLQIALLKDAIIVCNKHHHLFRLEPFAEHIRKRLLFYVFWDGRFAPPDDPRGRDGPSLKEFLRVNRVNQPIECKYGRQCTYGNRCKYAHSEDR